MRLPPCRLDLERLKGYRHNQSLLEGADLEDLEAEESLAERLGISPGGAWSPKECRQRHRSLIVVPYRDRPGHLARFLRLLHPYLREQGISYAVMVVEQAGGKAFNRAKLFNVGFAEGVKAGLAGLGTCLIFHDADLVRFAIFLNINISEVE